ncbi:restriction endonuclease subunit S [Staphylococcus xylosus]
MEFKEVKLGEISNINMGQSPRSEFYSEFEGTPFLQGNRTFQHIYPLIDTYTNKITKLANKNDILFSVRAPVGDMNIAPVDLCIGRGLCAINSTNSNQEFLFYLLKSKLNELESHSTGTIFSSVNKKTLENFIVKVPSDSHQKNIGRLLSNLDKKIEINQNIIANLEELSQTLFKRWFVDFEFPDENGNPYKSNGGEMVDSELGAIPKGWNVKNLDDIANYMNGLAMQKFKPTDNQNSLPVVKIKELKNGSTDENSNRCTSEIPEKALIVDGDIIFSWSATLLVKMWCGGKAGLNQHLFKVSSDKYPKWFYYYWTKRYIDYFIGIANDKATTMGHINRKHLSHAKILTPNDQTLEKFSRTFDDLLEKELSVSKESKRLTELRDTLLPKLMSGEIEIPTDIEVNEDELSI